MKNFNFSTEIHVPLQICFSTNLSIGASCEGGDECEKLPRRDLMAGNIRLFIRTSAVIALLLCLLDISVHAAKKVTLLEINVSAAKDKTAVIFTFSEPVKPTSVIQLSGPDRLVIEVDTKNIYYDQEKLDVQRGLVKKIRFELENSQLRSKKIEYIAIDTDGPFEYAKAIGKKEWRFVLKTSVMADIHITPIKTIQGRLDLAQALAIARSNYVPAQIAQEKMKLARMRKWEALRALFPAMTAKYEQTRGESRGEQGNLSLFGFKERILSFQVSQPLYQGKKLAATYEQARVNFKIAELQYHKIVHELEFEVIKAYMNVVKFQANRNLYDDLYEEVQKDFKTAKRIFNQKLSTRVEYLNVQSKRKQVKYQHASIEKDLELAKAQLLQILNIDMPGLPDVVPHKGFSKLDITLKKLLHQMRLNQPELRIAEFELKLAELGKLIGHSGRNVKIELSGSMGRSASNYNTEEFEWKNDFSGGVKLSKPFGGNTFASSYLYDDTSAKLGQTSRTLSETGSAQVSILDNLKSLSDSKESDIELSESSYKHIETKRNAAIEVKKSFYNYEKAVIQLQGLQEEVSLNEEELTITSQKKDLNMAQLSELVESRVKLAGSKSSLNESFSFYHISLSGINKAIGLPGFYKPNKE